jgi:hypothetical protein
MTQSAAVQVEAPVVAEAPSPVVVEAEAAPVEEPLDRASKAADRARKASAWKREQQLKIDKLAHNSAMREAEAHALRKQADEAKRFQEGLKADPYGSLKKLGLNDRQISERIVQEGSIEAVVRDLKSQLEEESKKRQALEATIESGKNAEREKVAEKELIKLVKTKATTSYPNLSEQPDRIVLSLARNLLAELSMKTNPETGRPAHLGVGFKEICDYLEAQYVFASAKARPKAKGDEQKVVESGKSEPTIPAKKSTSTLTQRLGSAKYSLPKNFDSLPDAQQRKILADQLRATGNAK